MVARGFEAELERLIPTRIRETMTGDEVGECCESRRRRKPVLGAEEREDGRWPVGWDVRAETGLLLVDHLAETFMRRVLP